MPFVLSQTYFQLMKLQAICIITNSKVTCHWLRNGSRYHAIILLLWWMCFLMCICVSCLWKLSCGILSTLLQLNYTPVVFVQWFIRVWARITLLHYELLVWESVTQNLYSNYSIAIISLMFIMWPQQQ